MPHEIRDRIRRPATPEEKDRHDQIRKEIAEELPDLKQWAKAAAAKNNERVSVGTVFGAEESLVVEAIDAYAATHALQSRGAVVRQALAHLLGIEVGRH